MKNLKCSSYLILVMLLIICSCSHQNLQWAINNSKLKKEIAAFIPIQNCIKQPKYPGIIVVGYNSFRFCESRSILIMKDGITPIPGLQKDKVYSLKIMGDNDSSRIGRFLLSGEHNYLFLSLKRFYTRTITHQQIYLTDDNQTFIIRLPLIKEGLKLDDGYNDALLLSNNDLRSFSILVSKLSKMEISVIHNDMINKNISKKNAEDYENYLSQFLSAPNK